MAIVMTKEGSLPTERLYEGKCYYCKSEYEAKQGDLQYWSDWRESGYRAFCQMCSNVVDFKVKR